MPVDKFAAVVHRQAPEHQAESALILSLQAIYRLGCAFLPLVWQLDQQLLSALPLRQYQQAAFSTQFHALSSVDLDLVALQFSWASSLSEDMPLFCTALLRRSASSFTLLGYTLSGSSLLTSVALVSQLKCNRFLHEMSLFFSHSRAIHFVNDRLIPN